MAYEKPKTRWLVIIGIVLLATILVFSLAIGLTRRSEVFSYNKVVVTSEVDVCSEIGRDIIKDGGSVVDGIIATAICIGVIDAFASGIGGGGFLLIADPESNSLIEIDFRETAPSAAHENMFEDDPLGSLIGGLAVAVPGELRGFEAAHHKFGVLSWESLFEPSIKLAREGFVCTKLLEKRVEAYKAYILTNKNFQEVYAPNRVPVKEGDIVYRKSYADTLEMIATQGADAFYKGEFAQQMVAEIQAQNGIITLSDLEGYKVEHRIAISTNYRGKTVYTTNAPTSGPILLMALNVLQNYDLAEEGPTTLYYHRLSETLKFGFAERSYLSDPAFSDNMDEIVERMIDSEYAAEIFKKIDDTKSQDPEYYGGQYTVQDTPGTAHMSAMKKGGMTAALTTTVNAPWGSLIMLDSGVILNNEMDDFSAKNASNYFGLPPSPSNYIAPYKRPMSSSVPTIIVDEKDRAIMTVGASGGTKIISATLQTIINYLDFGFSLEDSVESRRIHDQLYPTQLHVETNFDTDISNELKNLGHDVEETDENGVVHATVWDTRKSMVIGAADSRKGGAPSGY